MLTDSIHLLQWFTVCKTFSLQAALASARYIDEELDGMLLATDVDVDAFLSAPPELEDTWAVCQYLLLALSRTVLYELLEASTLQVMLLRIIMPHASIRKCAAI
jgi:hypothetical protein